MKKTRLLAICGNYPYFDLAFLRQIADENSATLDLNIKRWMADGTLLPLRRGMYALDEPLRKAGISSPAWRTTSTRRLI